METTVYNAKESDSALAPVVASALCSEESVCESIDINALSRGLTHMVETTTRIKGGLHAENYERYSESNPSVLSEGPGSCKNPSLRTEESGSCTGSLS